MNKKLPWDKLQDESKRKAYHNKDPRVPEGWSPALLAEKKREARALLLKNETRAEKEARILREIQEKAARKAKQVSVDFWYYTHPEAVVIDLTENNVHLGTEELMMLAERSWDDQGISPKTVQFRVNDQIVLTMPNPNIKNGPTLKFRKTRK